MSQEVTLEQEVRKILLMDIDYDGTGFIARIDGPRVNYNGVVNGWLELRLFGMKSVKGYYRVSGRGDHKAPEKTLMTLGRRVNLRSLPEATAMFHMGGMTMPTLLVMERNQQELVITAYSARNFFSYIRCNRLLKAFDKRMPSNVQRVTATGEEYVKANIGEAFIAFWSDFFSVYIEKFENRKEKKAERKEKKAERKEKKRERRENRGLRRLQQSELKFEKKKAKMQASIDRVNQQNQLRAMKTEAKLQKLEAAQLEAQAKAGEQEEN